MPARWTAAEFTAAIDREGGDLLRLFSHTVVNPHRAPAELYHLCVAANAQMQALDATLDRIAETLGYDREES